MSSENSEILIRALEASGSEREAKLARAILGNPAAPAADPAAPAAPTPAAPVPAAAEAPAEPTLDQIEALGRDGIAKLESTPEGQAIVDRALAADK